MTNQNDGLSAVNHDDLVRLALLEGVVNNLAKAVEKLSLAIAGDPSGSERPGILVRVDRIERNIATIKWLATGGLVSVLGTAYALLKMSEAIKGIAP